MTDGLRGHRVGGTSLAPEVRAGSSARVGAERSDEAAGAYVHVPFCRSRCRYCGFASEVRPVPLGFGDALFTEVEAVLAGTWLPEDISAPAQFDTLYLGGGTPSGVDARRLARWIGGLRARLPLTAEVEITVELNPDDVDESLLAVLVEAGVNRVSVGVQSFRDGALRWMGRRHTAEQAREALRRIRRAGPIRLSVDLIYGWPGQDGEMWAADLREAVALGAEHLSAYALTVEPGTPLAQQVRVGKGTLPSEAFVADRFAQTGALLGELGWEHYEVSSFARCRAARSRHNQKYWHHIPYVGLGPGAHSQLGRWRWWNAGSVDRYLSAVARGESARVGGERLGDAEWWLEAVMLGMRTARGVPESLLMDSAHNRTALRALCSEGLLRQEGGRVRPTERGLLFADGLPLHFEAPPALRPAWAAARSDVPVSG